MLAPSDSPTVRIGAVEGAEHQQLYDVRGMRTLPDAVEYVVRYDFRRVTPPAGASGTASGT